MFRTHTFRFSSQDPLISIAPLFEPFQANPVDDETLLNYGVRNFFRFSIMKKDGLILWEPQEYDPEQREVFDNCVKEMGLELPLAVSIDRLLFSQLGFFLLTHFSIEGHETQFNLGAYPGMLTIERKGDCLHCYFTAQAHSFLYVDVPLGFARFLAYASSNDKSRANTICDFGNLPAADHWDPQLVTKSVVVFDPQQQTYGALPRSFYPKELCERQDELFSGKKWLSDPRQHQFFQLQEGQFCEIQPPKPIPYCPGDLEGKPLLKWIPQKILAVQVTLDMRPKGDIIELEACANIQFLPNLIQYKGSHLALAKPGFELVLSDEDIARKDVWTLLSRRLQDNPQVRCVRFNEGVGLQLSDVTVENCLAAVRANPTLTQIKGLLEHLSPDQKKPFEEILRANHTHQVRRCALTGYLLYVRHLTMSDPKREAIFRKVVPSLSENERSAVLASVLKRKCI